MAEIQIIKATFSDIDQIREISIQTFTETFGSVNTKQNIDDYVTTNLDLKVLALEIKSRQSSF